jgi:hypothetical protein
MASRCGGSTLLERIRSCKCSERCCNKTERLHGDGDGDGVEKTQLSVDEGIYIGGAGPGMP